MEDNTFQKQQIKALIITLLAIIGYLLLQLQALNML